MSQKQLLKTLCLTKGRFLIFQTRTRVTRSLSDGSVICYFVVEITFSRVRRVVISSRRVVFRAQLKWTQHLNIRLVRQNVKGV